VGNNKHLRKKQISDVNRETDARFHAQTGYKPGMPLDLKDSSDRAMSKVWLDVHAQVAGENDAGKMVRTFDEPRVAEHLDHAKVAHLAAINHMVGASSAKDNAHLELHLRAAKEANTISRESCAAAAEFQPPSVTKFILDQALAEVSKTAPLEPTEVPVITSGAEEGPVMAPTEQPQANQPTGPVMPGDPEWVDYADSPPTAPTEQRPDPIPGMLAPENDPWDERYKPPMQADSPPPQQPTEQAPTQQTQGPKGPPPGWKSPPEWKDYTGEKPTHAPAPPTAPQRRPSGRGRTSTPSGGPSAGQIAVGIGVTAAFIGVAALFRRSWR